MKFQKLSIPDCILLEPNILRDERGFFSETYNKADLAKCGIAADFIQDNHSLSIDQGTVRGLHFQIQPKAQDKLIRVISGAIVDVAVDIRVGSPRFGHHVSVILSEENWKQLWVPKGFAHGFCTLEPKTEVFYKVTEAYSPEHDLGLAWDDPALSIDWMIAAEDVILSQKDRKNPRLTDLPAYFNLHFPYDSID